MARRMEIGCWALGSVLLTIYFGARAHGEIGRRQAIKAFETSHVPDQALWSADRIHSYAAHDRESEDPERLPAALLRIPKVDLEAPVYVDTGERNLNRGAGLVEGTASPGSDGNIAIAAHRDGYFRALQDVALGDLLELESPAGQRGYRGRRAGDRGAH